MKQFISIMLLGIIAISISSCKQKNNFEAHIEGWGNDTILMHSHTTSDEEIRDTLIAKDGFISYNLTTDDTISVVLLNKRTVLGRLYSSNTAKEIRTIIYPGSIEFIKGTAYKDRIEYTSKGSEMCMTQAKVNQETLPYKIIADSLNYLIDKAYDSGNEEIIKSKKQLFTQRSEITQKRRDIKKAFIRANPDNQISGLLALGVWYDSLTIYVDMLTPKVRNGFFKRVFDIGLFEAKEYLLTQEAIKHIGEGKPAPKFTLINIDGKEVSLSDYKGKWVVLDFWGSWCGWCIVGFPEMKKSYNKHKNKVEFIGIACGDTDEDWRKSVSENKLPWIQLINSTELDKNVAIKYAIESYPTKIIITPEQTIAKIVVGELPSFYTDLDKLLK